MCTVVVSQNVEGHVDVRAINRDQADHNALARRATNGRVPRAAVAVRALDKITRWKKMLVPVVPQLVRCVL